jgi:DoxX-like family
MKMLWAGRIITSLVAVFLLFDSNLKVMKLAPAVEATAQLGYPVHLVFPIGIAELICVILFVIPRTSILGAILLTGYLGGATATKVRLEDPWFLFSIVVGALVWGGLYLRDERLRILIPLRAVPTEKLSE